jgi:hypothetical protein
VDDELVAYRNRDTHLIFETGGPLPAGATFEAEIREEMDPASTKIADWAIDDSAATTTGVLHLSIPAGTITSSQSGGYTDVVQVGPGQVRLPLCDPIWVALRSGPTVVGAG